MRWPDLAGIENEDIVADLLWGFLFGVQFHQRPAPDVTAEVVREESTDILQQLEDRADASADSFAEPIDPYPVWKHEVIRKDLTQRVNDILLEDPSVELGAIHPEVPELRNSNISWEAFCSDVVYHLMDAHTASGHPPGTIGQWRAFWKEHGPIEEFDVEVFVTPDRVASIIAERRLVERRQLRNTIKADAELLVDKIWRGTPAADVLPTIVDEGPISSREVADSVHGSSDHEGAVTRLAKDLAGQECESRPEYVDVWDERPLLRGDPREWKPTAYGKAVNHMLGNVEAREEGYGLPAEVATRFPKELLNEALNEVGAVGDGSDTP